MGNERVTSLDLHANKITAASGPDFFDLLVNSTRLVKLDLDYNKSKVMEQDNRVEEVSLTSSQDFTAWICEALIFAPREEKIQFGRLRLCDVAEQVGLPEVKP
jgi:Leucine-rich repeat (LRR) protein